MRVVDFNLLEATMKRGEIVKVILEFDLNDEGDRSDYDLHNSCSAMHSVLWEFQNYLRQKYKHADPPNKAAMKEFDEIRDKFWEIINEEKLEL